MVHKRLVLYKERDRETERQRDTETETETETQGHRGRDTHKEREMSNRLNNARILLSFIISHVRLKAMKILHCQIVI